jgi:hypothetical protein
MTTSSVTWWTKLCYLIKRYVVHTGTRQHILVVYMYSHLINIFKSGFRLRKNVSTCVLYNINDRKENCFWYDIVLKTFWSDMPFKGRWHAHQREVTCPSKGSDMPFKGRWHAHQREVTCPSKGSDMPFKGKWHAHQREVTCPSKGSDMPFKGYKVSEQVKVKISLHFAIIPFNFIIYFA